MRFARWPAYAGEDVTGLLLHHSAGLTQENELPPALGPLCGRPHDEHRDGGGRSRRAPATPRQRRLSVPGVQTSGITGESTRWLGQLALTSAAAGSLDAIGDERAASRRTRRLEEVVLDEQTVCEGSTAMVPAAASDDATARSRSPTPGAPP